MTDGRRLSSPSVFAGRWWRNALWALAIIAGALAVGIAGYAWFGPMDKMQAFANAAMILSGMGPLDRLDTPAGQFFEGVYALVSGFVFFAAAGLFLVAPFHRLMRRFHLEDDAAPHAAGRKET